MRTAARALRAGGFRAVLAAAALAAVARPAGAGTALSGPAARLSDLLRASRSGRLPVVVRVFPTVEEQAAADGDSAFATYALRHHRVEVHVAKDAPDSVDLV
ncbi:MAG TPA: hypothetical protein VG777_05545, partial [Thermoanaerobaculia bacterium]|nr:hypothetical protein [Thermoanaerobaculia bacterium]